jgi:hypothetical protein
VAEFATADGMRRATSTAQTRKYSEIVREAATAKERQSNNYAIHYFGIGKKMTRLLFWSTTIAVFVKLSMAAANWD